jgi:hypothetical protein
VASFLVRYWHFLHGTERNLENLIQDDRSPGRDLNPKPHEYEEGAPNNRPRRSVIYTVNTVRSTYIVLHWMKNLHGQSVRQNNQFLCCNVTFTLKNSRINFLFRIEEPSQYICDYDNKPKRNLRGYQMHISAKCRVSQCQYCSHLILSLHSN